MLNNLSQAQVHRLINTNKHCPKWEKPVKQLHFCNMNAYISFLKKLFWTHQFVWDLGHITDINPYKSFLYTFFHEKIKIKILCDKIVKNVFIILIPVVIQLVISSTGRYQKKHEAVQSVPTFPPGCTFFSD